MMVVVIVGLIMATGVPAILTLMREAPLRKAVNDVLEICSHARAQAILQERMTTVVFHPRSREVALIGGSASPAASVPPARAGRPPVNSAKFDSKVTVEALGVNDVDDTDADEALVHFFPNGTSDEMTLVLSSDGKYRKITLEVTTALATVKDMR